MTTDSRKTLLIIDDEETFRIAVKEFLESDGLAVLTADSGEKGLEICSHTRVDVVLLDQRLPDAKGYDLVPDILAKNDQTKIVFITAFPSFENARQAIRSGAHDYLPKPVDLDELKVVVDTMLRTLELEQVAQVRAYEQDRERRRTVIIGSAAGLSGVMELVATAAQTDAPVLITGETGTGKNLAARTIHFRSSRSHAPFISINCATLPENLVEAELFGYEKGAFTGALATKKGLFEMADGGTIFLDEISEMPMNLQSKLLQVIDDGRVRRIGGTSSRTVNVRIIAATNADLETALGATFRKDLYFRLSVILIPMPPLREHREDIPALSAFLLEEISGGRPLTIPEDDMALLMEYDWPGNVRELRNILERAAMMQRSGEIRPSLLLDRSPSREKETTPREAAECEPAQQDSESTLGDVEKQMIIEALHRHGGNMVKTAKALGTSLSTLKRRVRQYGLRKTSGPD